VAYSDEVRAEAVRLRLEARLSLKAIVARLGIAKGTASKWLREHPLPVDLVKERMAANGRATSVRFPRKREAEPTRRETPAVDHRRRQGPDVLVLDHGHHR